MIKVELKDKRSVRNFLVENYGGEYSSDAIISIETYELFDFVDKANKNEWFVIEYRGTVDKIPEYLSLLTYRVFMKYLIFMEVSEMMGISEMSAVSAAVDEANAYSRGEGVISVKINDQIPEGELMFRLVVPRYAYGDMFVF